MAKEVKDVTDNTGVEPATIPNPHTIYSLYDVKVSAVMEEKDDGGQRCIGYDMVINPKPIKTGIKLEADRIKGVKGLDRAAHSRGNFHIAQGEQIPNVIIRRISTRKEYRETGREFQDTFTY